MIAEFMDGINRTGILPFRKEKKTIKMYIFETKKKMK
jgi:hypothetical protein